MRGGPPAGYLRVPIPHAVSPVHGRGGPPCIGRGPKPVACALAPKGGGGGHPHPPSRAPVHPHRLNPLPKNNNRVQTKNHPKNKTPLGVSSKRARGKNHVRHKQFRPKLGALQLPGSCFCAPLTYGNRQ